MKKEEGEPWATEKGCEIYRFCGNREITLKSDAEPAIKAFRNRAAEGS